MTGGSANDHNKRQVLETACPGTAVRARASSNGRAQETSLIHCIRPKRLDQDSTSVRVSPIHPPLPVWDPGGRVRTEPGVQQSEVVTIYLSCFAKGRSHQHRDSINSP